jgi:hypothetical protein
MSATQNTMYEIDMNGWKMGDYSDFFSAGNRNDFERQFELMGKVVKAWPFPYSAKETASYRELSIEEFQAVLKAVGQSISARFSKGN